MTRQVVCKEAELPVGTMKAFKAGDTNILDDADSAAIVDRVELEPALAEELAEAEELARLHSDVSLKLAAKRRRAVRVLQKSGLGTRDIAELLELSQQRVSQIARGTR
jgi:DNA-directed RNA polymerase specialized sigma subunit